MEDLLFLVHRIPYPPNKGDKIRSFHILEYLSRAYRIHLGTFIDQPSDRRYCAKVSQYCTSTWFGTLSPRRAKARSLVGFLTGEALTLPYYRQPGLTQWIRTLRKHNRIRRVLVYSSAMAQYVLGHDFDDTRRVIDFVDVDSDKWRQYSAAKRFPMDLIYRREAARLSDFERRVADIFDASVFVSEQEAALFRQNPSQGASYVFGINNGVDADYFAPDPHRPTPFRGDGQRIVFTGAMDYWANEDGADWFARQILPALRQRFPACEFFIVGMNPTDRVRQLERLPGVTVTGSVPDVRPYLQHASAVAVPLRIARGIQNKVLEAMAMGRPVVTTPQALEGINARAGREIHVAEDAGDFVEQVARLLAEGGETMGADARRFVVSHFSWESSLPKLLELLEDET
ncbi:TIGR03087 family PEP-CTERM/XrtA system glycosyltransferase [Thiocystis violascens]|uniref:Sugar transferase, PEP-CTERM/EpsH1 system associated n=1 Tax=Thiocystis violascens (strain ATCC 17096 / DSM 198 / 6111) TaxID=765911 RepID=I3YGE7_THIV6|nr:TIGR03087 family PEP-CTERM/XrtA system glycosyltransferase [Thiocystis violascens]AFL76065.1 sugar transferase, PEP-CTERM/EpsH1 system associated [Thiocystis violascens DSM 198]